MGLFSSPLARIQLAVLCLGSWGCLMGAAIAQEQMSLEAASNEFVKQHIDNNGTALTSSDVKHVTSLVELSVDEMSTASAAALAALKLAELQLAQNPNGDDSDFLDSEEDADTVEDQRPTSSGDSVVNDQAGDDELGILRVRAQPVGSDSELGLLRIRPNNPNNEVPVEVEPEPTRQTTVFLTGRSNVYGGNNLFRTPNPIDDRIYQAGVGVFAFPRLSDGTNLVLSAEANLARYEDLSVVDYNELQFQAGIRKRLSQRSYGQLNWRFQELSTPGSDAFFTANYVELLLSRRDILTNRIWLDTYYQARFSHSDPKEFSRFSQIATGSLNYGFSRQTRASLLYQLFLDDYTEVVRFDTYHQLLAQISHDLSSSTRISLFTGFRFGDSTLSTINFDDTIYGASINFNVPLF